MTQSFFYKICLILLITCAALSPLSAQSRRSYERAGDAALAKKDYANAILHYATILTGKPGNTRVQWKYAECARMFYALPLAEKAYLQVENSKHSTARFPLLHYRLGEVKKMAGQYPEAIRYFEQFIAENPPKAADFVAKARSEIEQCQWAGRQSDAGKTAVSNLGNKINSPYSDFAAVQKGDTLLFSSYRFDQKKEGRINGNKITKMMYSVKGAKARELRWALPSGDSVHIAHAAFTPDSKHVIFTFCKNINAFDIRCELWMVTKDMKGKWTKPERLPEPVNQNGFTATQPNISIDAHSNQLRLWFSSDRPGGKGGLDIWSVALDTNWFCPCNTPIDYRKPQRLPRFETPIVAAAINTDENEASPFYHRNTHTLYFSSNGLPGMGGYDIFKSSDSMGVLQPPVNVGLPLNSSYNDVYFTLKSDGLTGYLSSNRPGTQYLDPSNKACCYDIFGVQLPAPEIPKTSEPKDSNTIAMVPKSLPNIPTTTPPIQLPQPKLSDFVGLPLYFDNDEPDKRTRKTFTQKTYEETVLAYLDRQDEYRERRSSGLKADKAEQAATAIDAFFDDEVRNGYDRLGQLCELLEVRLAAGETVEIIIKGFTSPRAKSDYNLNLGRRRISSVRNHFEQYDNGKFKAYIRTGKLIISETSFGETTAKAGISDDLNDEINSIYAPDAARERRVEIVEIKGN